MSEEKRRKCIVNYYGDSVEGYFESYGNIKHMDEGNNPYTSRMAIVEKTDGQVITIEPSAIKFVIDKKEKS